MLLVFNAVAIVAASWLRCSLSPARLKMQVASSIVDFLLLLVLNVFALVAAVVTFYFKMLLRFSSFVRYVQ